MLTAMNEGELAWTDDEKGHFHKDYFVPVVIQVAKYQPQFRKGLPIPPNVRLCHLGGFTRLELDGKGFQLISENINFIWQHFTGFFI